MVSTDDSPAGHSWVLSKQHLRRIVSFMPDYQPPNDILDVLQAIEFEEALEPTDPRRIDTRAARGSERTLDRLARKLGT
jgi:hypothetical protein